MRLPLRGGSTEAAAATNAVNLLSPWVLEELRIAALRRRLGLAAASVLVLVVGAWGLQHVALRGVQNDLAAEQATTAGLEEQIAGLSPVRTYVDGVRLRATDVQASMRTEVSFSRVLLDLQSSLPPGLEVDELAVSLLATDQLGADGVATVAPVPAEGAAPAPAAQDPETDVTRGLSGAACPGPDPFDTTPSIGCVTISGTAADRDAVGRLVQRLSRKNAFSEPFVTTTTTDAATSTAIGAEGIAGTTGAAGGTVTFSGTVGLTPAVFTGRYDDLTAALGLEESP